MDDLELYNPDTAEAMIESIEAMVPGNSIYRVKVKTEGDGIYGLSVLDGRVHLKTGARVPGEGISWERGLNTDMQKTVFHLNVPTL